MLRYSTFSLLVYPIVYAFNIDKLNEYSDEIVEIIPANLHTQIIKFIGRHKRGQTITMNTHLAGN